MGSTTMGISVCMVGHRLLCIHDLMAILVKYTMTNFGYYGYSFSLLYVLFNILTVIIGTIFCLIVGASMGISDQFDKYYINWHHLLAFILIRTKYSQSMSSV
jgi:hypothetical protein